MRKVPIRNQRSKRIKAKHVLRICVLLGVCIWLIYQVKHSHEKKKEFEEKDTELSKISQSGDELIKLGRKGLRDEQEMFKNNRREEEEEEEENEADEAVTEEKSGAGNEETKHDDELDEQLDKVERATSKHDEDEEVNEHGENDGDEVTKETSKHDEDEQEEEEVKENEHEEDDGDEQEIEDDDAQDGGIDVIDEHDQVKTGDTGQEDEFIDEGKEIEEKEDDEEESERRITHEAREENYKADDASSAVSHENEFVNSETGNAGSDNSDGNSDKVVLLADRTELDNVEGKNLSGLLRSTTSMEEKDQENRSLVSDVKSIRESGNYLDARNIMEVKAEISDNSRVNLETSGGSDEDGAKGVLDDLSLARNATEVAQTHMSDALNVTIPANNQTSDFLTGQSLNLSSNSSSYLPDEMTNSNSTAEDEANPESSSKKPSKQNLESSSKNANVQNLEFSRHSSTNQTMDTREYDPIDYSDAVITHEKKRVLTDPDTVHSIRTGDDIEEIAAQ